MAKQKFPEDQAVYLLVEIYGLNVWLFTQNKDFQRAMKAMHGESDTDGIEVCGFTSYVARKDGTNAFIIGVFDGDPATLVHEAAHATLFMCDHLGFEASDGDGEPFAYLQEFLYTKFLPYVTGNIKDGLQEDKETEETEEKTKKGT